MLDGDPTTAHYRTFVQKVGALPGVGSTWRSAVVFDFGADVPINRIRFFPRLSRREAETLDLEVAQGSELLEGARLLLKGLMSSLMMASTRAS